MFKAVIIDGQPLVRAAIKAVLTRRNILLVAETDNGIDGLDLVHANSPDLVILDVDLAGMSGLEVMERVYSFDKNIELLVLTASPATHYYNRCRAAWASTFLSKTCSIEALEDSLTVLMTARERVSKSARSPRLNTGFVTEISLIESLSNRELTVFELIAKGMSNKGIAEYLQISNKTVSTHKTRIQEKLNVFSVVHLLEMARRNGLVGS